MKQPKTPLAFPASLALATGILFFCGPAQTSAQSVQKSSWGVVLGADKTIGLAVEEATNAAKKLGQVPQIYKCGNWFRTVAVFADKSKANAYLSKAQLETSYNPYIVDITIWCPRKSLINTQIPGQPSGSKSGPPVTKNKAQGSSTFGR